MRRLLLLWACFLLVPAAMAAAQSTAPALSPAPSEYQTPAAGQPAAAPKPQPPVVFFVRNLTRADRMSYFTPATGGGNPDYGFIANRLTFGVQRQRPKLDFMLAAQYVQFGGLPSNASGPGQLGLGSTYYDTNLSTNPGQLYLRYANVKFKNVSPGLNIQVGRMPYASGSETASGDPKIEATKRLRLDSRMIGEFEWAMFQRGYDGARIDYRKPAWEFTVAALKPTQGGFERRGNTEMTDITVLAGTVGVHPSPSLKHTELQGFAYWYGDTRAVRARPDNEGRAATAVNVKIATFGGALIGAYPSGAGQIDTLVWIAGQSGTWYDRDQQSFATSLEVGYQWTKAPWRPWVRAGWDYASGDDNSTDGTHKTFFPMLPTTRKYSLSVTYAPMNLDDRFIQAILRPSSRLNLRADLHVLGLAQSTDRWYTGSGATQATGTIFGYAGRASQGMTGLGTVVEGSADYTVNRHWSVNGYVGHIQGRDVVQKTFAGDILTYAYLENVVAF